MDRQKQDSRYKIISSRLQSMAEEVHERNRKHIRISIGLVFVCPVVLGLIRAMTGSDKAVFLLLWLACMFGIAVYMIGTAYYDDLMQKKLKTLTDQEAEFDNLLPLARAGKGARDEDQ